MEANQPEGSYNPQPLPWLTPLNPTDALDWNTIDLNLDQLHLTFDQQMRGFKEKNIRSVAEPENSPNLPYLFGTGKSSL
jgi:hypothetical protein